MNAPDWLKSKTARTVFIRDLKIPASIGIHDFEKESRQTVCINVEMETNGDTVPLADDYANAVCYESAAEGIRKIVSGDHINLVETLAERIAELCLQDSRVGTVRVRVEKPDILSDAAAVGVEIERYQLLRPDLPDEG